MQFNSIEFLIFLPIVFILYWCVFKGTKAQNILITISSCCFYASWNLYCLALIVFTIICSYFSAILLRKYNKLSSQKIIASTNIIINLTILCVFKYYNFFAESLSDLLNGIGIYTDWVVIDILLPVGISFYTFQALSYTIDVYKRRIEPTNDFIAFFAYISFFPQLVAGPIERATNLLPQFLQCRHFNYAVAVDGMRQILWGLVKKMLIADNCAIIVDSVFRDYQYLDGSMLLIGAIFFSFQIYGDFSGYSDIAIGCSKLFGINLMKNFNFPYFSRDIAEFWRRWHISLTTWFRDYVYIPLGGSRCGRIKTIRNTFIIFLLSGLWHGANWTFVCWGLYHAILFMPVLLWGCNRKNKNAENTAKIIPSIKEMLQMVLTFFLVVIGWIIFRAENVSQALEYITRMFTEFNLVMPPYKFKALVIFLLVFIVLEWLQRNKDYSLQFSHQGIFKYRIVRFMLYYTIFMLIFLFGGTNVQFIYFQF